ncbi:MAG: CBS domain-containing protein [Deltaproteobacteria bacterium]|jgi:CBS domain-containing protein|nr:CBS domain-containing protein [Deltaproteobacteria bacterium]
MERLTVRDLIEAVSEWEKLPIVTTESSLQDVVRVMVKGHRRRIVYVVDDAGRYQGAITLEDLKNVIFHFYLNSSIRDALVVTEHIEVLFASEKAKEIMNSDSVVCHENDTLHEIIVRMNEWDIMDIPVLDRDDRVIADLDFLHLLAMWLKKGIEAF